MGDVHTVQNSYILSSLIFRASLCYLLQNYDQHVRYWEMTVSVSLQLIFGSVCLEYILTHQLPQL